MRGRERMREEREREERPNRMLGRSPSILGSEFCLLALKALRMAGLGKGGALGGKMEHFLLFGLGFCGA